MGSVGDVYDNALAESFVDSFKTELIADRVWQTRVRLELASLEYINWFNHDRLHSALGDIPPPNTSSSTSTAASGVRGQDHAGGRIATSMVPAGLSAG